MAHTDDYIIQDILAGREATLRQMYPQCRAIFLAWAKKHFPAMDEETHTNAYQEAMAIFYENVMKRRLVELTAPLHNYIIGIGRLYLLKQLEKNEKTSYPEEINSTTVKEPNNFLDILIEEEIAEELKLRLQKAWQKLSPQCQKCLDLFYLQDYKISEIVIALSLKDENTVSAHKSRCMRRLRELIETI